MDQLPRYGKRELICLLLFTCNYVVSVWRGFLFLWVLGMGYVILLWHSLSLPYNYNAYSKLKTVKLLLGLSKHKHIVKITDENDVVSVRRCFLFILVLGIGCFISFWHSSGLPYNYFAIILTTN